VLPAADAAGLRGLLKKYLDLCILFYQARNGQELRKINADTGRIVESYFNRGIVVNEKPDGPLRGWLGEADNRVHLPALVGGLGNR
jgi:hypothetical protein